MGRQPEVFFFLFEILSDLNQAVPNHLADALAGYTTGPSKDGPVVPSSLPTKSQKKKGNSMERLLNGIQSV